MSKRMNLSSGAKWEEIVGYSRAVKVGNTLEITGTVALKDGEVVGVNDPYQQTKRILEIIAEILEQASFSLEDVVRTRMFVTDISRWEEIARGHHEVFHHIKPATTMVEVKALISPEFIVEIEATAMKPGD